MSNKSKKGFNGQPQAKDRRVNVISRLEAQLKRNTKPALVTTENGSATWADVRLEESDIKRINKEIEILKTRI